MVESDEIYLISHSVHKLIGTDKDQYESTWYHLKLLADEGYVVADGTGGDAGYRVTAQGQARYDWYESNRDPFATA